MKLGWKSCQLNSEKAGCCTKMDFWSGKEKDYVWWAQEKRALEKCIVLEDFIY